MRPRIQTYQSASYSSGSLTALFSSALTGLASSLFSPATAQLNSNSSTPASPAHVQLSHSVQLSMQALKYGIGTSTRSASNLLTKTCSLNATPPSSPPSLPPRPLTSHQTTAHLTTQSSHSTPTSPITKTRSSPRSLTKINQW